MDYELTPQVVFRCVVVNLGVLYATSKKDKTLSMREWFSYQIQDRTNQENLFTHGGRLFQQFLVDSYTMVETEELDFHRAKQSKLRCDTYSNIRSSIAARNTDPVVLGKPVVLSSSFTGGLRYMRQNYMDAMALCRWYGCPNLFITITCNPNWPEIARYMREHNLTSTDRPNVLSRVFKMKLDQLMKDVKELRLFGHVQAVVCTVEFLKRGIMYAHICLFLRKDDKVPNVEHINKYISAEIPDPNDNPDLYKLVSDFMIFVDSEGYPVYRRRDDRKYVEKSGHHLHNGFVILYNATLLKRYQCHINVEWCNQMRSTKYLFKYTNKGPDRVSAELYEPATMVDGKHIQKLVNEIKAYLDCRYLSACEAAWRLFGFEVQYRTPSVERLSFHLPGEQQVLYDENSDLETILHKLSVGHSMFEGWMKMNELYPADRELTYAEFPTKYVWNAPKRIWTLKKQGKSIGRIHNVPISTRDAFYCRMLLNSAKGCRMHDEIKKVNGVVYPTYKEACYAAGLLEDDKEYIKYLVVSDEEKKNINLFYIEELMRSRGSILRRWPEMPYPDERYISEFGNRLIYDELDYNPAELQSEYECLYVSLKTKQKSVYDIIMNSVETGQGGVYFVYVYGGTRKTFLWKTHGVGIRRKGDIVLNVPSSGIASLLMSEGRTAHSRFHIPININETSTFSICPQSDLGALLKKCKLIIWDEAPMTNKLCFEALDRTLRDILRRTRITTRHCKRVFKATYLWDHCKVLKLTTNMRLTIGASPKDVCEIQDFAKWILKVEDGELGEANNGEVLIDVPEELLIDVVDDPVTSIIDFTYLNLLNNINNPSYFQEKAILAPTNEVVKTINDHLLNKFPGEEMVYLSCDSIDKTERGSAIDKAVFSSEFSNGLKFSGFPNHKHALKVDVPIMLL
nr:hypothetical protein [Tanacetum cinerariifolium]